MPFMRRMEHPGRDESLGQESGNGRVDRLDNSQRDAVGRGFH